MDSLFAVIMIVIGLPNTIWPYEIARFGEQLDSIGSKRSWSSVEPADWKVKLNRLLGIGAIVVGVGGLLVG